MLLLQVCCIQLLIEIEITTVHHLIIQLYHSALHSKDYTVDTFGHDETPPGGTSPEWPRPWTAHGMLWTRPGCARHVALELQGATVVFLVSYRAARLSRTP